MPTIEELQAERARWKRVLCGRAKEIVNLRQRLHVLEDSYSVIKTNYESVDRELAMIDGRHKVIEPTTRKTKTKELSNKELAAAIGKDRLLQMLEEVTK